MLTRRCLLALAAGLTLLAACSNDTDRDVLATVDGFEITAQDVAEAMAADGAATGDLLSVEQLSDFGRAGAMELNDPLVVRAVSWFVSTEAVRDVVEPAGVVLPDVREPDQAISFVRDDLIATLIATVTTPPSDAERDELIRVEAAAQGEVTCSAHILLANEEDALAIVDRLEDGEDFALLAAQFSIGPSGPAGGDLGCQPSDQVALAFVPEFADALNELAVGERSGPVQSDFGWHVIRRYDSNSLAEAAVDAEIQQQLTVEFNRWLADVLADTEVTVDPAVGTWNGTNVVGAL